MGAGLRSSDRPPPALWRCRRGTSPISSANVLGDYVRSTSPVYLTSGGLPFVPLARVDPTTPKPIDPRLLRSIRPKQVNTRQHQRDERGVKVRDAAWFEPTGPG